VTIVYARSRHFHRRSTRIDITNAGDIGTINGFAYPAARSYAAAGGGHNRPRPPGVMLETAVSTLVR
jgi:hypothetical protein